MDRTATTKVSGEEAARFDAVRIDGYATVNQGDLTSADEETGHVAWKDRAEVARDITLGAHRIKLLPKHSYGR